MNTLEEKAGEATKLTQDEIEGLKKAAGNKEEWDLVVDKIKRDRYGQWPPDWYKTVILGGIIKGTITVHSSVNTQESFGID